MAHLESLEGLHVSNDALNLFAESLARERAILPVSVTPDQLHVVFPADDGFLDSADVLQFLYQRQMRIDTADRALLTEAVDFHYRARFAKVVNCEPVFRFRCPNRWESLESTETSDVRYCEECDQYVYFCRSDEEIATHVELRHCVAFAPPSVDESITTMGIIDFVDSDDTEFT